MAKILTIFDFDDTLVASDTEVVIRHSNGKISYLNSEEFAKYDELPGDKFDFSNFDTYPKNPKRVQRTFSELESAISRGDRVIILTARSNQDPVDEFMKNHGYKVEIITVGSTNPMAKAARVLDIIKSNEFDLVQVFEDNARNIRAIKKVVTETGVKFRSTLIDASLRSQLLERFLRRSY